MSRKVTQEELLKMLKARKVPEEKHKKILEKLGRFQELKKSTNQAAKTDLVKIRQQKDQHPPTKLISNKRVVTLDVEQLKIMQNTILTAAKLIAKVTLLGQKPKAFTVEVKNYGADGRIKTVDIVAKDENSSEEADSSNDEQTGYSS